MAGLYPIRRPGPRWRLLLAVVCVFLAVLVGVVQIVHVHADGTDGHANCSLCVSAHMSVHGVEEQALAVPVRLVRRVEYAQQSWPVRPSVLLALFTRPPPAA